MEKAQYNAVPESCKGLKFPHGAIGKTFHAILLKNINDRYGSLSSFVKETGLSSSKPNLIENLVLFQKQPSVGQRYRSTFDNPKSELSEQVSEIINLTPKQIFDGNGFEVIPQASGVSFIPGDGNCLFRAVSEAEYGAQDKHANLREQTCAYIRRNIDFYGAFGFDDNYLLRLRKNGFWGGNAEIEILSRLVNRKIIVYQPGGEIYMETPVDSASKPIYLLICNFRKPKQNDSESFNHFNLIASLDNWKKSL